MSFLLVPIIFTLLLAVSNALSAISSNPENGPLQSGTVLTTDIGNNPTGALNLETPLNFPSKSLESPLRTSEFLSQPDFALNRRASLDFPSVSADSSLSSLEYGRRPKYFQKPFNIQSASSASAFGSAASGPDVSFNRGTRLNFAPETLESSVLPLNYVNRPDVVFNPNRPLLFSSGSSAFASSGLENQPVVVRTRRAPLNLPPEAPESPFSPLNFDNSPNLPSLGFADSPGQGLNRRISSNLGPSSPQTLLPFLSPGNSPDEVSNISPSGISPRISSESPFPSAITPSLQVGRKPGPSRSKLMKLVPGVVDIFAVIFSDAVKASESLTNIYNLQTMKEQDVAKTIYQRVYLHFSGVGSPYAFIYAALAAQALTLNVGNTPPPLLSYIYGLTAGMELYKEGILTSKNASEYANRYLQVNEQTSSDYEPNDPTTKIIVITRSFKEFLTKLNVYNAKTLPSILEQINILLFFS